MKEEKIIALREKVRIIEREAGGVFEGEQECCGVTTAQCHTLLEIGNKGPISLVDLAAELGLDTSTLSRTIQGLVMLEMVNRQINAKDRRYVVLSLTEQGRRVVDKINALYNAHFNGIFELLPEDRREVILEAVEQFADALRRYKTESGCCQKGTDR